MWEYQKILQYPINIKTPNAKFAQIVTSQYGGAYCKKIYISPKKIKHKKVCGFRLLPFRKQSHAQQTARRCF